MQQQIFFTQQLHDRHVGNVTHEKLATAEHLSAISKITTRSTNRKAISILAKSAGNKILFVNRWHLGRFV